MGFFAKEVDFVLRFIAEFLTNVGGTNGNFEHKIPTEGVGKLTTPLYETTRWIQCHLTEGRRSVAESVDRCFGFFRIDRFSRRRQTSLKIAVRNAR